MPALVRPSAMAPRTSRSRGRQDLEPVVGLAGDHELGDDLGIQGGPAAGDPAQGVHELADVGDAVLEQVADAARPVGQQERRVVALDVLAEDQDRRARHQPAGLDGRAQPLVASGSAACARRRRTRPAGAAWTAAT